MASIEIPCGPESANLSLTFLFSTYCCRCTRLQSVPWNPWQMKIPACLPGKALNVTRISKMLCENQHKSSLSPENVCFALLFDLLIKFSLIIGKLGFNTQRHTQNLMILDSRHIIISQVLAMPIKFKHQDLFAYYPSVD